MNTDRPELGSPEQSSLSQQQQQPNNAGVGQQTIPPSTNVSSQQQQPPIVPTPQPPLPLTTPTEPPLHSSYSNYFRPYTSSGVVGPPAATSPYRNYSMTRYSSTPYMLSQTTSTHLPNPQTYYHESAFGGMDKEMEQVSTVGSSSSGSKNEFRVAPMRNSKAKFTADDDELLIELKENQKYSWKRIAQHFPGRTPGALQVRYCTKLRKKSQNWTSEDLKDLTKAVQDYHNEKWHIVAQKMDNKFTSNACREQYELLTSATRWQ